MGYLIREEPHVKIKKLWGKKTQRTVSVVEILPSDAQFEKLKELVPVRKNLRGSITEGDGELIGALGEIVVADYFKLPMVNDGENWNPNYDLIHPEMGLVDVKSKRQNVLSLGLHYANTVWDASKDRQKCDYYCFTRIRLLEAEEAANDFKNCVVWILGVHTKKEYFKKASLIRKGEVDPSNSFKVKDDCWNLPISQLEPLNLSQAVFSSRKPSESLLEF